MYIPPSDGRVCISIRGKPRARLKAFDRPVTLFFRFFSKAMVVLRTSSVAQLIGHFLRDEGIGFDLADFAISHGISKVMSKAHIEPGD